MKKNSRTNPKSISVRVVSMIYSGATWEDVCKDTQLSKQTLQRYLRENQYKGGGDSPAYKRLLELAKENAKARKVSTNTAVDPKEIHIVEPGFIINAGAEAVRKMATEKTVVIPLFCIGELKKLAMQFTAAEQFLKDSNVTTLFLKEETLYVEPDYPVEDRVRGIVALAVDLNSLGMRVTIHTNSHKVRMLAELQGAGLGVEILK